MDWTLDKSRPISRQLCEKLCLAISSGELKPGQRIYSVREVALAAGVNPNTVQKSFTELEKRGIIHSVPCSGWYVNEATSAADIEVKELRRKNCEEFLSAMRELGCNAEQTIEFLKTIYEEREGSKYE